MSNRNKRLAALKNKTQQSASKPARTGKSFPPKVTQFDRRPNHHGNGGNGCGGNGCGGNGCGGNGCGGNGCGGCGGNGCGGCGGNGCGGNGCGGNWCGRNNNCGFNTMIYYDQFGFPVYQTTPPLPTTCTTCPMGFQGYGGLPAPGMPFNYPSPYIPAPPVMMGPPMPPMLPQTSSMGMCPLPLPY